MFRVRVLLGLVLLFGLNTQANEYIDESLFKLSLAELLAIEVEVGSTVSLITREQWRQRGARRTDDALGDLISTFCPPLAAATPGQCLGWL